MDECQTLREKGERFNQNELWAERLKHRDSMTKDAQKNMQDHFARPSDST